MDGAGGAPVGLLAGSGEFPAFLLSALRERGRKVVLVGFRNETSRKLLRAAAASIRVEVGELGRVIGFLKDAGVKEVMMAGCVKHANLYTKPRTDSLTSRLLARLVDKRADTLLKAAEWQLSRAGIRLVSAMQYLRPLLPKRGILTRRRPTEGEWKDVIFGHEIARRIAGEDIGQTVAVKDGAVLAVEAMEGTDAAILRAGALGRGGIIVVKVAKPKQDFRFDVPVMGVRTIATLKRARASVMAVEAEKTIMLERRRVIALANAARISLVAL